MLFDHLLFLAIRLHHFSFSLEIIIDIELPSKSLLEMMNGQELTITTEGIYLDITELIIST